MSYDLKIRFKPTGAEASSLTFHLQQIQRLLQSLAARDPFLKDTEWLIAQGTRDEPYRYVVFDENGPTTEALAVLREKLKQNDVIKSLTLWNGQEEKAKGASLTCLFDRKDGMASSVNVSMTSQPGVSRLGDWHNVSEALAAACELYDPIYAALDTRLYDPVFKDRPGVGWMLYLPLSLTSQQVPEARALVPVMNSDKKQRGTIIVSVTDEPFSDRNPEHVKIANAIEIRLVHQDLLPRYGGM